MVKFSFVVAAEPYAREALDTVLNLSEAIIKKGHEVLGIFFYGSGVYSIKGNRELGSSMRDLSKKLVEFSEKHGAKIAACSTWISITGIKSSEFIENACLEGLGGLSELITNSDRVIFFGPGR